MLHVTWPAPITVRLMEPSANLGLTELHVTPGVIDEHARELFLYAQCQMLALALHEQTGWPVWVAEQQLPSGTWAWTHVAVQTPDSRWLDIDGPRPGRAVTDWISGYGLPVRLRLLDALAEWHVMLGRPASTPATWWRTQITSDLGIALTEASPISYSHPADGLFAETHAGLRCRRTRPAASSSPATPRPGTLARSRAREPLPCPADKDDEWVDRLWQAATGRFGGGPRCVECARGPPGARGWLAYLPEPAGDHPWCRPRCGRPR